MHHSNTFKPFAASLCKTSLSWGNALHHYQRSLVECGSSLELEHAQRVALLFQKGTGEACHLGSWARLFTFEGIPTCALMLRALVGHDLWKSAIKLWQWNPSAALADSLVDELMSKKRFEQSMSVLHFLLTTEGHVAPCQANNALVDMKSLDEIDDDVAMAVNDAIKLAVDPTFVPAEYRGVQSGLSRLINMMYPKKSQWELAVSLLVKLSSSDVSSELKDEMLAVAAARALHQGKRYEDTFLWIKNTASLSRSASLQRTFLRSALVLRHLDEAVSILENLSKRGVNNVPTSSLHEFCKLFIQEHMEGRCIHLMDRFVAVIFDCLPHIRCKKTKSEIKKLFEVNSLDTSIFDLEGVFHLTRDLDTSSSDRLLLQNEKVSISELDRTASLLIKKGHWKISLRLLHKIVETHPQNEKEKLIFNGARASSGNWESAILFFV